MPATEPAKTRVIAVDLIHDDGDWSALRDIEELIDAAAAAVARHADAGVDNPLVSIALSCDEAVASLNSAFRHQDKPTNVLSFPAGPGSPEGLLGDIALAEETIIREAAEQGTPFAHHVQHLVVHGLLHLIGYDHETPGEAEDMEALEIQILADLGIDNPYTGELQTNIRE
jgi:probable rRNA maturation factor